MNTKRVPNPVNIRLSNDMKIRAERLSARFNISFSDIMRAALNEKLSEWESQKNIVLSPVRGAG
jgi:predicted transcriptional regulator